MLKPVQGKLKAMNVKIEKDFSFSKKTHFSRLVNVGVCMVNGYFVVGVKQ